LTEAELLDLGKDLDVITSRFPLKPFDVQISNAELESILSLPLWQKRNELYSVWVATEMLRALHGHRIELHHDKGRIEFAFHETLLATIHSSPGPFKIISERRSPLKNPQGAGRTANVQPDHALWTKEQGEDVCRMVVEVKHYKKAASRNFSDVFEDYARAFPLGHVYLVNHGPIGERISHVSSSVNDRCHAVEEYTSEARDTRARFAKAIQECVGEPIPSEPLSRSHGISTVLVIDVSASMQKILGSKTAEELIQRLIVDERPRELVAIDSSIRGSWAATEAGFKDLLRIGGGITALAVPVRTLFNTRSRILLVTDEDGLSTLYGFRMTRYDSKQEAPAGVFVYALESSS
jgi:hypothetical protein